MTQLIRKATNQERMFGPKRKRLLMASFPEKSGFEVVYKPYGPQGAGFYYETNTFNCPRCNRRFAYCNCEKGK